MYRITIEDVTLSQSPLARGDEGRGTMPYDDLRNLFRDEASIIKMKQPLYGNGHLRLDPLMRQTLCELAWFYDSSRIEEAPCWDPSALEKMRKPVIGFSHYRVMPDTMPLLFDLAWFHGGLLDGNGGGEGEAGK